MSTTIGKPVPPEAILQAGTCLQTRLIPSTYVLSYVLGRAVRERSNSPTT